MMRWIIRFRIKEGVKKLSRTQKLIFWRKKWYFDEVAVAAVMTLSSPKILQNTKCKYFKVFSVCGYET